MESWVLSQGRGKIITVGDRFSTVGPNGERVPMTPLEFAVNVRASQIAKGLMADLVILPNQIDASIKAQAEVWQGQWVVKCPWSGVAHAGLGLEDGDLNSPLFMCCSCWNQLVGGKVIEAEYPADWQVIEALLVKRPDGRNRGWIAGQTVADLQAENALHGVHRGV